jgi:hypothetical protein
MQLMLSVGCTISLKVLVKKVILELSHTYIETDPQIATRHAISRCSSIGTILSYEVDDTVQVWSTVADSEKQEPDF